LRYINRHGRPGRSERVSGAWGSVTAHHAARNLTCRKAHMRHSGYGACMIDPVTLLAALADPTRLAVLRLLRDGQEHCVCEMVARLGATQSRVSRHMAKLRAAGLVTDRRDAQWVRYRLSPALPDPLQRLLDAALELPSHAGRIAA
jgi:ArsR family transcriptional regulator